jgi:hypothetical protein
VLTGSVSQACDSPVSATARPLLFRKSTIDRVFEWDYRHEYPKPPGRYLSAVRFAVAINTLKKPIDSLEDRWARMRTHKRVISRVKFLVEWDEDSQKQRANAVTVDVSHSGCMAIVGAPLPLHKQVRLIHPESGRKAEALVVWRDHEAWDTGFELNKPDASFWGLKP